MKKVLSWLLVAVMLICMLPTTVFAGEKLTVFAGTVANVENREETEVSVPLNLKNNTGLEAIIVKVQFDKDALKMTKVVDSELLQYYDEDKEKNVPFTYTGFSQANNGEQVNATGEVTLVWYATNSSDANGQLATLKFAVKAGASAGQKNIAVAITSLTVGGSTASSDTYTTENGFVTLVNCLHTQKTKTEAKASTCKDKGWDAYSTCDACNHLFNADGEEISAIPYRDFAEHDFTGKVTNDDTLKIPGDCTTKAEYYYSCTVCGAKGETTFESAYGTHTLTKTEAKDATCTEAGNNEYWTCSTCDKVFKDEAGNTVTSVEAETIPAGHKYEFVNEVAATCNKTGTEAHYKCENCLQLFKNNDAKTPVNAEDLVLVKNPNKHTGSQTLQHNETLHWYHCGDCEADYSKANHSGGTATCTEQAKCTTCSQPYGALKAHTLTKTPAKDATCEATGNIDYWTCSRCHKLFKDEAGTQEIEAGSEITAKLPHDMTHYAANPATCTEDGTVEYWSCSICKKNYSDENGTTVLDSTVDPALGHQMTKTEAVAPTCTEDGYEAYWTCSACSKMFSDANGETEINAKVPVEKLGHDMTHHERVEATCQKTGMSEYYKCSRCEKLFTTSGDAVTARDLVIDKIPHDYKGIYNETHHWTFCANCGATTDKAAHDFTVDEATGTKTCNCGYVVHGEGTALCNQHDTELVFDETHHWRVCKNCSYAEDKDAHGFGDWETDVEATTTTDGLKHRTCKECGYVQQEVIAKPSTTPSTRPTTRPSGGSNATSSDKVKSSKTFDAGIAAYVGLSVLSLTGSALVIGKKKEF